MVKFYRATTSGEGGGWERDRSYLDLMTHPDGTTRTGPTHSVQLASGALYAPFERGPEFYVASPLFNAYRMVWTDGINGCVALVYVYRLRGEVSAVAMNHLNCGAFEHPDMLPKDVAKRHAFTSFDEIHVVAAHGSDASYAGTHRHLIEGGFPSDRILDYFDPLLRNFVVTAEGWIGVVGRRPEVVPPPNVVRTKRRHRCYISSAAVAALGLPDDCEALLTLRRFRDGPMASTAEGRADIACYYRTAPAIVECLDARRDARETYDRLWRDWILPAVADIEAGRDAEAHARYRAMVAMLARETGIR